MKSILSLAFLCASTVTAAAQEDQTWNVGVRGSLAFTGSIDAKASAPPVTAKADLDVGGGASFFYGVNFPAGFDAELELLYRYLPMGQGSLSAFTGKVDGNVQVFAPMANLYWTVPMDLPVKPYIGGGVGYAFNDVNIKTLGLQDQGWHLAYNLMAGIAIPSGNGARFTIGYRWFHEDIGVECAFGVSCSGKMNSNGIDVGVVMDLN